MICCRKMTVCTLFSLFFLAFAVGQSISVKPVVSRRAVSGLDLLEEVRKQTKLTRDRNEVLIVKAVQDLTLEIISARDKILDEIREGFEISDDDDDDGVNHTVAVVTVASTNSSGDTTDAPSAPIKCDTLVTTDQFKILDLKSAKLKETYLFKGVITSGAQAREACDNSRSDANFNVNVTFVDLHAALNAIQPTWKSVWTSGRYEKDNSSWFWGSGFPLELESLKSAAANDSLTEMCLSLVNDIKRSVEIRDCADLLPGYVCESDCV